LAAVLSLPETNMKNLMSSSMFGLVAVPPAPYASLGCCKDEPALAGRLLAHGFVWHRNEKRQSWRALLAVAVSAITLIGVAMVVISVRATSAPPAINH
jgi:hypothetical protein